jgi:hypothetical protein
MGWGEERASSAHMEPWHRIERLLAEIDELETKIDTLEAIIASQYDVTRDLCEQLAQHDREREEALNILFGCAGSTARRVEEALGVEPQR